MYGPGLAISDFNLGILYLLAVSSLATYGILLAGFPHLKFSPSFMWIKEIFPIEFQEHLLKGQLEAKYILFKCKDYISLFIKYKRSTTNRWVHNRTKILTRAIGILDYSILRLQFLITIIVWNNMAWLNFIFFMCAPITSVLFENSYLNNNKRKPGSAAQRTPCWCARGYNFNIESKRFYSKTTPLYDSKFNFQQDINIELNEDLRILHSLYIKDLFKDRAVPVIPFDSNLILATCNLGDVEERSTFLKEWGSEGGIYIIEYKYNPLIYYIGRTTLIKRRMNNHIKAEAKSKFHVFLNLIGLDHFKFSILEICSPDIAEQGKRENYYLQKFLPILNTTFSSSYVESAIYTSLTNKLISLKSKNYNPKDTNTQISNKPITIFVYSFDEDKGINSIYDKYNSMAEASKIEKIAYNTLLLFRDTNVPFRGKLYYTKTIIDFNSILDQIKNNLKDVKIYSNIAIKVWAYDAKTLTLLEGSPFQSKSQAANHIGISRDVVNYFLDTKKPEGVKGTYLFSRPLEYIEIESLKELSESITLGNKVKVWAYDAKILDLINNEPFFSISAAADYFNVNYRTISRNLDTKNFTKQNNMLVYLFKKEINLDLKIELKLSQNFYNVRTEIWVYRLDEKAKLYLLPNQPFKTKKEAARELHIHNNKINEYLDTGKEYKGFFIYSSPV